MKRVFLACAGLLAASACVAPIPPVEVTRFHTNAVQAAGAITVVAAPGLDAESLEFRTYAGAVTLDLVKAGYSESRDAKSPWIAEISFSRGTLSERRSESPVRIGVGGGTGGVGVGASFPIGTTQRTRDTVVTKLAVRILSRADGKPVWEGRAETSAPAIAPAAQPGLAAAKLSSALFSGFPGRSGETITVK